MRHASKNSCKKSPRNDVRRTPAASRWFAWVSRERLLWDDEFNLANVADGSGT